MDVTTAEKTLVKTKKGILEETEDKTKQDDFHYPAFQYMCFRVSAISGFLPALLRYN